MAGLAWCVVADDVLVAVWLASGIVLRPCRQSNTQMLWVSNHRVVKRGHLKRQVIRNCFKYTTITLNCISINHFFVLLLLYKFNTKVYRHTHKVLRLVCE